MKTGYIALLLSSFALMMILATGCTKSTEDILRDKTVKSPQNVEAFNNLAYYLSEIGKYEEALEVYDKSLALRPDDFLARNNKGQILYQMGRYKEALEIFSELVKSKEGKRSDVYSNIAMCHHNMKNYPEAYKNYKIALEMSDKNKPAQDGFNLLLMDLKNEGKSAEDMEKLLSGGQAPEQAPSEEAAPEESGEAAPAE